MRERNEASLTTSFLRDEGAQAEARLRQLDRQPEADPSQLERAALEEMRKRRFRLFLANQMENRTRMRDLELRQFRALRAQMESRAAESVIPPEAQTYRLQLESLSSMMESLVESGGPHASLSKRIRSQGLHL